MTVPKALFPGEFRPATTSQTLPPKPNISRFSSHSFSPTIIILPGSLDQIPLFYSRLRMTFLVQWTEKLRYLALISLLLSLSFAITCHTPFNALPPGINNNNNNTVSNAIPSQQVCNDSQAWIRPRYKGSDCVKALRLMHRMVTRFGRREFEISPRGSPSIFRLPSLKTPWREREGSCTVTIAMMSQFGPEVFPTAQRETPWPVHDQCNFQDLWTRASALNFDCAERGKAGWSNLGESGGVGVFLWGIASPMDRILPD